MSINPNVAEVASLLGETSRATILTCLMDGRFHTASELAFMAAITPQTASFHLFSNFGLNLNELRKKRRSFSHACLDWSERCHHVAGALGHGLMVHFLELGWIIQVPSIRAIKVADKGKEGFKQMFNIIV